MSKWIVMGASSFSGRAFCKHLERHGHDVIRFSRPQQDLTSELGWVNIGVSLHAHKNTDYVVNFAALNMVADSWNHYADYYSTNVLGVAWFARACQLALPNLQKFIQVSTPEVYGDAGIPLIGEDRAYNPSTPYAVSRAAADMDLMVLHRATGFPVCFTRTVNVFGPGQQPYRVIPKTILKILRGEKLMLEGGGRSLRSFIHIDDVARGIELIARSGRATLNGNIFHMSGAEPVSIRSLVYDLCVEMGVLFENCVIEVPERLGKDKAYILSDAKIRNLLGWAPEERPNALREMVLWYREHAHDYARDSLEYTHKG